jgi:hypothetical protein
MMPSIKVLRKRLSPPEQGKLEKSWHRLQSSIRSEMPEILAKSNSVIPEVSFDELQRNGGAFPEWARDNFDF